MERIDDEVTTFQPRRELSQDEIDALRERLHREELQRRMLEYETNPLNFLRMPRSGSRG